MNPTITPTGRIDPLSLTVDAILNLDEDCEQATALDATPEQLRLAADAWCYLLGLPGDDEGARDEAMSDFPVLAGLVALSARDFVVLWGRMEWEHFERSDGPDGEAWAWRVGLRACELRDKAGPMLAAQSSVATLALRFRDMQ